MKKGHTYTKDMEDVLTSLPKLSLYQTLHSYFVYQGQAYNVERCSQAIFRAYVEQVHPGCNVGCNHKMELQNALALPVGDALDRWYVLDTLCELKAPGLALYSSELEASTRTS